jgi:hypothetical protein
MKYSTRAYEHKLIFPVKFGRLLLLFISILLILQFFQQNMVKYDVAASPMIEAFPITNENGHQIEPALAYNHKTDTFLVAWRDASAGSDFSDIDAQLITNDGELLGDVLPITTLPSQQRAPAIASHANTQDFIVTWVDNRNKLTSDSDIYDQVIRGGNLFGPNQPVNMEPGRVGGVNISPCAGSDSYLIAWHEDKDAGIPWLFYVYGRQIANNGIPFGAITPITADHPGAGFQQVDPDLVMENAGERILAVFRDARNRHAGSGTNDDIYGQLVNCAGQPLDTTDLPVTTQYSPAPGGNKQNGAAAAYDTNKERFLVVWQDERNDPIAGEPVTLDIYGQLLSADGDPLCTTPAGNFAITTADGNQQDVDVAYSSNSGAFLVVWTNYWQGDGNIYARLVSSCGEILLNEIVISDAAGDQTRPAVTYHEPSGRFLIVWQNDPDGNGQDAANDIYGAFYLPPPLNDGTFHAYMPIIAGTPLSPPEVDLEEAQSWLAGQTVNFAGIEDIPGYGRDGCDGAVARYKDEIVCYPAIPGNAIVSFDFCNYGTPDQNADDVRSF